MTGRTYAGVTLRALVLNEAYYPHLLACARDFARQTGATVEFESPRTWWHLHPTVDADLASGAPRYDLLCNDAEFQYRLRPHLLPLNAFIARHGTDMDDFFTPVKKYGLQPPDGTGQTYGMPLRARVPLVFYRTDLIGRFPTTWEDFDAALRDNTGGERFGLGFAGGYNEMVTKMFLARFRSLGGALLGPEGQPRLNGAEGIAALTMLKEQTEHYAPPGVHGWDYEYAGQMFREGRLAMLESIGPATLLGIEDPVVSDVAGRWSVGLYPLGGAAVFTHHLLYIFRHCAQPEAAFDFIAHCTNPASARRLLMEYGEDAARPSVWREPRLVAARPHLRPVADALEQGFAFLPWVPQWLALLRILWDAVSACLAARQTPADSLNGVAAAWSRLLTAQPLGHLYQD